MLRALGAQFTRADGSPIGPGADGLGQLGHIDLSGLDRRLDDVELITAADVANPLLGSRGSAEVFGPQKGADADTVATIAAGLERLHAICAADTCRDIDIPGGGAAGGLGAALSALLNARMTSGAELVLSLTGLNAAIPEHDLVLTGEGSFDEQSLNGKEPHAVVKAAHAGRVPVVVVSGRCTIGHAGLTELGIVNVTALDTAYTDPFDQTPSRVSALVADVLRTMIQ